jgi:hypothetical protein
MTKKIRLPFYKRLLNSRLMILAVLLGIVVLLTALEVTNTTSFFHKERVKQIENVPTAGQQAKGPKEDVGDSGPQGAASSSQSQTVLSNNDKNTATATMTLQTPSGNFVSNHHPNISGNPAPNQEQSVCNTTVGATCQIIFTSGNLSKSLSAKTTDHSGSAYWSWSLQEVGLSAGSWKIQAKATLGSQTQIATDALTLEVAE